MRNHIVKSLWTFLFLGMVFCGVFVSCTEDEPLVNQTQWNEDMIVGTWKVIAETLGGQRYDATYDNFMYFGRKGEFLWYDDYECEEGTYSIENTNYVFFHGRDLEDLVFIIEKLTDNELVLSVPGGDGQSMFLTRNCNTVELNYGEMILGRWRFEGDDEERILEIQENGVVNYIAENATVSGTYQLSGFNLTVQCGPIDNEFTIFRLTTSYMLLHFKDEQERDNFIRLNRIVE